MMTETTILLYIAAILATILMIKVIMDRQEKEHIEKQIRNLMHLEEKDIHIGSIYVERMRTDFRRKQKVRVVDLYLDEDETSKEFALKVRCTDINSGEVSIYNSDDFVMKFRKY